MRSARVLIAVFVMGCSGSSPKMIVLDVRNQSQQAVLEGGEAGADYWVIPFSSKSPPPLDGNLNINAFMIDQNPSMAVLEEKIRLEHTMRENVLSILPNLQHTLQSTGQSLHALYARTQQSPEILRIGSPFQGDGNIDIQGSLKASSALANLYVDTRFKNDISNTVAHGLIDRFSRITLPRLRKLFGQETDIDGNRKIDIFLSSKEKLGTNIVGFFRPNDLLPSSLGNGNEREIIYARIPDPAQPMELYDATLAHEAYHLLAFGLKTLGTLERTSGQSLVFEDVFLAEGLAHLSEDLTGWGICTAILAKIYLSCLSKTSLTGAGSTIDGICKTQTSGGDSLARRGGMMLFLLYLFQQSGGADYLTSVPDHVSGSGIAFLQDLTKASLSGLANIESSTRQPFFVSYADFAATLVLDGASHPLSDRFAFEDEVEDAFTGLPRYLRLNMTRQDPSMAATVLKGPEDTLVFMDDIKTDDFLTSGLRVYEISIEPMKKRTLTFHADPDLDLGVVIIRQ